MGQLSNRFFLSIGIILAAKVHSCRMHGLACCYAGCVGSYRGYIAIFCHAVTVHCICAGFSGTGKGCCYAAVILCPGELGFTIGMGQLSNGFFLGIGVFLTLKTHGCSVNSLTCCCAGCISSYRGNGSILDNLSSAAVFALASQGHTDYFVAAPGKVCLVIMTQDCTILCLAVGIDIFTDLNCSGEFNLTLSSTACILTCLSDGARFIFNLGTTLRTSIGCCCAAVIFCPGELGFAIGMGQLSNGFFLGIGVFLTLETHGCSVNSLTGCCAGCIGSCRGYIAILCHTVTVHCICAGFSGTGEGCCCAAVILYPGELRFAIGMGQLINGFFLAVVVILAVHGHLGSIYGLAGCCAGCIGGFRGYGPFRSLDIATIFSLASQGHTGYLIAIPSKDYLVVMAQRCHVCRITRSEVIRCIDFAAIFTDNLHTVRLFAGRSNINEIFFAVLDLICGDIVFFAVALGAAGGALTLPNGRGIRLAVVLGDNVALYSKLVADGGIANLNHNGHLTLVRHDGAVHITAVSATHNVPGLPGGTGLLVCGNTGSDAGLLKQVAQRISHGNSFGSAHCGTVVTLNLINSSTVTIGSCHLLVRSHVGETVRSGVAGFHFHGIADRGTASIVTLDVILRRLGASCRFSFIRGRRLIKCVLLQSACYFHGLFSSVDIATVALDVVLLQRIAGSLLRLNAGVQILLVAMAQRIVTIEHGCLFMINGSTVITLDVVSCSYCTSSLCCHFIGSLVGEAVALGCANCDSHTVRNCSTIVTLDVVSRCVLTISSSCQLAGGLGGEAVALGAADRDGHSLRNCSTVITLDAVSRCVLAVGRCCLLAGGLGGEAVLGLFADLGSGVADLIALLFTDSTQIPVNCFLNTGSGFLHFADKFILVIILMRCQFAVGYRLLGRMLRTAVALDVVLSCLRAGSLVDDHVHVGLVSEAVVQGIAEHHDSLILLVFSIQLIGGHIAAVALDVVLCGMGTISLGGNSVRCFLDEAVAQGGSLRVGIAAVLALTGSRQQASCVSHIVAQGFADLDSHGIALDGAVFALGVVLLCRSTSSCLGHLAGIVGKGMVIVVANLRPYAFDVLVSTHACLFAGFSIDLSCGIGAICILQLCAGSLQGVVFN